jgi:phospholipase/carboxylesterase
MADVANLLGPSMPPASAGKPRQLIVFLHGFGADGNDLIGLAPYFADVVPDAEFLSPHAPYPCQMAGFGRQWFNVYEQNPDGRLAAIRVAADILDRYLDEELAKRGLTDSDLALIGFSQGTMMSLFVAPRRARPCAGVIGYSGRLESPDLMAKEMRSKPPVLLIHGDRDDRLPVDLLDRATEMLKTCGVAVEHHVRPGLGHSIDEEGIRLGRDFLTRAYAGAIV